MNKTLLQILFQSIKYFATSIALRGSTHSGIPNFSEIEFIRKKDLFNELK